MGSWLEPRRLTRRLFNELLLWSFRLLNYGLFLNLFLLLLLFCYRVGYWVRVPIEGFSRLQISSLLFE